MRPYYGVPQIRERLFIVAFARTLGTTPMFPEPTHYVELPRGYEGSRNVALKHVDRGSGRFHEIQRAGFCLSCLQSAFAQPWPIYPG